MDLDFATIAFYAFAVLAVVPGLMILVAKDIVRVAFWLLASLSGVACLYFLLGADFLGGTQILVYIGGIMVLILFGIMMTNKDPIRVRPGDRKGPSVTAGFLVAIGVFGALMPVILGTGWKQEPAEVMEPTTATLGEALLTDYVLPFEVISVLLLMVLCGAAYIARRGKEDAHD